MSSETEGKYDQQCGAAREACQAAGCLLIIFQGDKGDGFSAQIPSFMVDRIPSVLRQVADDIERQSNEKTLG